MRKKRANEVSPAEPHVRRDSMPHYVPTWVKAAIKPQGNPWVLAMWLGAYNPWRRVMLSNYRIVAGVLWVEKAEKQLCLQMSRSRLLEVDDWKGFKEEGRAAFNVDCTRDDGDCSVVDHSGERDRECDAVRNRNLRH